MQASAWVRVPFGTVRAGPWDWGGPLTRHDTLRTMHGPRNAVPIWRPRNSVPILPDQQVVGIYNITHPFIYWAAMHVQCSPDLGAD